MPRLRFRLASLDGGVGNDGRCCWYGTGSDRTRLGESLVPFRADDPLRTAVDCSSGTVSILAAARRWPAI